MKKRVSIIGMGMVGRAWSIAFARAGCSMKLKSSAENSFPRRP